MATKSLVFLTFIAGFLLEGIECGWGWSFRNDNGPKYWSKREEDCSPDGPSKLPQSPIDIPKASKRKYNVTMKDTVFTNYDKLLKGDIKNFGNIVRFQNITTASGESVSISKGLLYQKVYIATEFHFHFGENDNSESGHRFEGKKYPMELHIVHHKNPAKKLEGAVIVVFFIEKDKKNITNEKYLPVTRLLEHFNFLGSHEKRQHLGFSLREITNDSIRYAEDKGKHLHFFQYNGSLDEPPCYAVEWLVFKDPVKLSYAQLDKFRLHRRVENRKIDMSKYDAYDKMAPNYRPLQPLGSRTVYESYNYKGTSSKPVLSWCLGVVGLLVWKIYMF